ncbi:V-type ATPase subunit subunit G family protein [Deinococcus gobiensis]|uniref:V-type ATPase subunit subunit G family protein n=1 Tax=Deinococcus gobiensis TaxID=502394 RepID=UPI002220519E|nr:V-type ATPase subunit subunit G family protein [Deinococcus gobiensis]
MSELASREAALDAQIEAAREEARRAVDAAEQEAARILQGAQAQVQAMQAAHEQALTAETSRIRDEARAQAEAESLSTRQKASGRVQQAAEHILRAVLP